MINPPSTNGVRSGIEDDGMEDDEIKPQLGVMTLWGTRSIDGPCPWNSNTLRAAMLALDKLWGQCPCGWLQEIVRRDRSSGSFASDWETFNSAEHLLKITTSIVTDNVNVSFSNVSLNCVNVFLSALEKKCQVLPVVTLERVLMLRVLIIMWKLVVLAGIIIVVHEVDCASRHSLRDCLLWDWVAGSWGLHLW